VARWTTSDKARIEYRRLWVARLYLRGLTLHEIEERLPLPSPHGAGLVNPANGKPYDKSTLSRDLTALRKQWQQMAIDDTNALCGRQVAELREARRAAWGEKDWTEVRLNMALEAKLLGTEKPMRHTVEGTGKDGEIVIADGLTDEQRLAQLVAVLDRARERRDLGADPVPRADDSTADENVSSVGGAAPSHTE